MHRIIASNMFLCLASRALNSPDFFRVVRLIALLIFRLFCPVHLHAPVSTELLLCLSFTHCCINNWLLMSSDIVDKTLAMLHLDIFEVSQFLVGFLFSMVNLGAHQVIIAKHFESFLSQSRRARLKTCLFWLGIEKVSDFGVVAIDGFGWSILHIFVERLVFIMFFINRQLFGAYKSILQTNRSRLFNSAILILLVIIKLWQRFLEHLWHFITDASSRNSHLSIFVCGTKQSLNPNFTIYSILKW